jgi:TPR repeat protein
MFNRIKKYFKNKYYYNFGKFYQILHDHIKSNKYYLLGCMNDCNKCAFELALYYQNIEKNYSLMKNYYNISINLNNVKAMYNLAVYYDYIEYNDTMAIKYYNMAIAHNHIDSLYLLGMIHQRRGNYELMIHYLTIADQKGHIDAKNKLYYHKNFIDNVKYNS